MHSMNRSASFRWCVAGVLTLGCQLSAQVVAEPMAAVIQEYEADAASVDSFYRIPCSETALDRREKLGVDWLTRLHGVTFDTLDQTGRVDYVLLRNELQSRQAQIVRERQRLAEMAPFLTFRSNIVGLALSSRLEAKLDAPVAATAINDLVSQVKALKDRIERGKNAKTARANADAGMKDAKEPATNAAPPLAVSPALAAGPRTPWPGYATC